MSKLSVVVGGQFGSEGKGAIAAHLASSTQNQQQQAEHHGQKLGYDVIAVRVAGPNAGHTVIGRCPPSCLSTMQETDAEHGPQAHAWKLRQVPVAAVSNPDAQLVIGAGSEIDIPVLRGEIEELDAAGYRASDRLIVDKSCTIIEDVHKTYESDMFADGRSTAKGIGAARSDRIMRTASIANNTFGKFIPGDRIGTAKYLNSMLRDPNTHVVIEGTQGYGLGLHTEFYPFTTSSDCRAIDFMAMAGVSPWTNPDLDLNVWVVFRVRPIRIAGNSGPLDGETKWKDIGRPEEFTTVTNKVRRVGAWNPALARDAVHANGGGMFHVNGGSVKAALTMVDHEIPGVAGFSGNGLYASGLADADRGDLDFLLKEKEADLRAPIMLVGTGPSSIIDLRESWEL
jgi:adenylosuccinate synthase